MEFENENFWARVLELELDDEDEDEDIWAGEERLELEFGDAWAMENGPKEDEFAKEAKAVDNALDDRLDGRVDDGLREEPDVKFVGATVERLDILDV